MDPELPGRGPRGTRLMTTALIDYGAGNLHSVHTALVQAGATDVVLAADGDTVARAERIVLPGVGAFRACRDGLYGLPGVVEAMTEAVEQRGVPFLGICVGMQLLADSGEEFGNHDGLGWIPGAVRLMEPADPGIKVPHMGWNDVTPTVPHPADRAGRGLFPPQLSFRRKRPCPHPRHQRAWRPLSSPPWAVTPSSACSFTRKRARPMAFPSSRAFSDGSRDT
jgi:glutamine amidotransferase